MLTVGDSAGSILNLSTKPATAARPPAAPVPAAVEIDNLRYSYGDRLALAGLSLTVPAGSIFGLLGPNGSGKSTLLGVLIGRRLASGGDVRVLGQSLSNRLRARVGIVFQEPSLDPVMTVRETMHLQARMFGLSRAATIGETDRLLERVGLTERASAATATLSGGMKRRLELARTLLPGPELILLDEPTLALDPDSRQRLWQHLLEANSDGCTLLIATNDVHEAERFCGTVALLSDGQLVAQGSPPELKRDLRRDAVRIEWSHDPVAEIAIMQTWSDVGHVRVAGRTTHVTVDAASPFLTRIFQQSGDLIRGVQIEESTLEDVYFQLVGKGIAPQPEAEAEGTP